MAISPVLLGKGEKFFGHIDTRKLGYRCTSAFTARTPPMLW
jgi:hypothetical protein